MGLRARWLGAHIKHAWDQLPDLAVVCFLGTGYNSFLELPESKSSIRFTYTPHANAVAEFSIAQMIDLVRGISSKVAGVQAGVWSEESTPSLVGARLGVAGMGHIGREVARMAHAAFGTEILYWNRTRRPELDALLYTAVPSLTELFETVDIVSVNFTYEPGRNEGAVGAQQLAALGADGFLVNTARQSIGPGCAAHGVDRGLDRRGVDGRLLHRADPGTGRRPVRAAGLRPGPAAGHTTLRLFEPAGDPEDGRHGSREPPCRNPGRGTSLRGTSLGGGDRVARARRGEGCRWQEIYPPRSRPAWPGGWRLRWPGSGTR